jgi:hypothetical protein
MSITMSLAAAVRSALTHLMSAGAGDRRRPTRLRREDLSPALRRDLGLQDGRAVAGRDPMRD